MQRILLFVLVSATLALGACSGRHTAHDARTPTQQRGCDGELMPESDVARLPEAALARLDRDCIVADMELAVLTVRERIAQTVSNAEHNSVIDPMVQLRLMFFAQEPVDPDWAPQTEAAIRAALAHPSPHRSTSFDMSQIDLELTCRTTMCLALIRPRPATGDWHEARQAFEDALLESGMQGGEAMQWERRMIRPPEVGMLWSRRGFQLPSPDELEAAFGERLD